MNMAAGIPRIDAAAFADIIKLVPLPIFEFEIVSPTIVRIRAVRTPPNAPLKILAINKAS